MLMPLKISIVVSLAIFQATAFSQVPPSDEGVPTPHIVQDQQDHDGQTADEKPSGPLDRMLRGNRRPEGAERMGGRTGSKIGGMRGRGGGGRRPITEADIETMFEIADSISPEWGSELRAMMADDSENGRQAIMKSGRRLFGLVMLKEKKPELFETRVEELRVQFDIRKTYERYQAALKTGDAAAILGYKASLTDLAAKIVDLELKARAMELAALDQAVQEMRMKLTKEIEESAERITGMIEGLLKPALEGSESPEPDGRDPADARSSSLGKNDPSSTSG
jgi:hypothetical protein